MAPEDVATGTERSFPFPFKPYNVQQQLMTEIFEVLERADDAKEGLGCLLHVPCEKHKRPSLQTRWRRWEYLNHQQEQVGFKKIMQLPYVSRTGKSLSILCSALHWLLDHYPKKRIQKREDEIKAAERDWISGHFKKNEVQELLRLETEKERCLAEMRERVQKLRTTSIEIKSPARKRSRRRSKIGEDSFLVDVRDENANGSQQRYP